MRAPPDKIRGPGATPDLESGFDDQLAGRCEKSHKPSANARQTDLVLIDRFGHLHTTAILKAWSPAALKVMQVKRIDGGSP
jgi:hypothetical protein